MFYLTAVISRLCTTAIISFLCLSILAQEAQTKASFPGGINAWRKYLERNLNYPGAAQQNNTQGIVRIEMTVDKAGKISEVKALNDPGDGLADEAVRVIKTGPDWIPAVQNGQPVTYRFVQTVTFRLDTTTTTQTSYTSAVSVSPNRYNQSIVIKTPRVYNGKAIEYLMPTYDGKGVDVFTADRKSYFINRDEALQQFGLIITANGFVSPEDASVLYIDNNGVVSDNYEGLKFVGGKRSFSLSSLYVRGSKLIDAEREPVFMLNGKVVTAAAVQLLNPYEIKASNLLKFQDNPAMVKLGSKGKNGMLILSTKLAYPDNYLYLLNGKEYANEEIAKLPFGTIKRMTITYGNRGYEKYGSKAQFGVVVIDTAKSRMNIRTDTVFGKTESPAMFPGGNEAWKKYIAANLRYPDAALKNKTEGTVRVGILISAAGVITEAVSYNVAADGLASEAVRLLKEGPQWIPAKRKGINVTYRLIVPVTFKMDTTDYF